MNLGSMMASRYIPAFKEEVQNWVTKLGTVSEILEQWVQVQAMWMYLEAVFTSGAIARQMPQEAKRFVSIDKNWEKIMQKAFETRNVVQYCFGNDVLKNLLPHLLEQLEVCQKALSGYLDQKRAAFPRFYFVSNAAILVIRDPYRSIWAEYKRYVNWKEVVAGRPAVRERSSSSCRQALRSQPLHSGALLRACFSEAHFHEHAQHLRPPVQRLSLIHI